MTFSPVPNTGPADTDPLTDDELSLLLAIPRAAKNTPNATLFRLPRGPDPTLGWVDASCAQVQSIVSRLAFQWNGVLSDIMRSRTGGKICSVGPGTIICVLVQPGVNALFHHLAFWALGCTMQYITPLLGEETISRRVQQSGCHIALCSEDDHCTQKLIGQLGVGVAVQPESERAFNLAMDEVNSPVNFNAPWPEPRRPTPATILQSSGTTGEPKLLKFSLYYYTIGHAWNCQQHLGSGRKSGSKLHPAKGPFTHPRLVISPPYWQSFYRVFFTHLTTATPVAFAYIPGVAGLSAAETLSWIENLQAGAFIGNTSQLRAMVLLGTHTELLQSLYSISTSGSSVEQHISDLYEERGIEIVNLFGTSELSRLLYATRAPYGHLRPYPDAPPPLVLPTTVTKKESMNTHSVDRPGREVQLWSSLSTCPRLAHLVAHGGVSLKLEPFPGEGPHHGELAFNWGDIFREISVPKPGKKGETELAYVHLGRTDDALRVGSNLDISASEFESGMQSLLEPILNGRNGCRLDLVQLFGTNLPGTALVVQLQGEEQPDEELLRTIREAVGGVNAKMRLKAPLKVDPYKRMLITFRDPVGDSSRWSQLCLLQTHKHTLRRWKNVQTFQPWLDQLEWN